jgi:hypothetical protein
MARLPGKRFGNTWTRKLDCGCIVKLWRYSGPEYYFRCPQHQREADEHWRQEPRWKKVLIYGWFALLFGASLYWLVYLIIGIIIAVVRR